MKVLGIGVLGILTVLLTLKGLKVFITSSESETRKYAILTIIYIYLLTVISAVGLYKFL